jgi:hypothetical protein
MRQMLRLLHLPYDTEFRGVGVSIYENGTTRCLSLVTIKDVNHGLYPYVDIYCLL